MFNKILIFGILLMTACSTEKDSGTNEDGSALLPAREEITPAMQQSFPDSALATLVFIKRIIDEHMQSDYPKRSLSYAYQQHALLVRLQAFDKQPVDHIFPFNGALRLGNIAGLKKLSFVTDKCGLKSPDGQVVNYYCPNLAKEWMDYLSSPANDRSVIQNFKADYLTAKTITPEMRMNMALYSSTGLDFSNPDQQLVYGLFQLFVAEEMFAIQEYNRITKGK